MFAIQRGVPNLRLGSRICVLVLSLVRCSVATGSNLPIETHGLDPDEIALASALNGRYAYFTRGLSLITVDLEAAGGAVEIAQAEIPFTWPDQELMVMSMACNGRMLAVTLGLYFAYSDGGGVIHPISLEIFDLSAPGAPTFASEILLDWRDESASPKAFLTKDFIGLRGYGIYDITNPHLPRLVPGREQMSECASLVANRYALVTSNSATTCTIRLEPVPLDSTEPVMEYTTRPEDGLYSGCPTFIGGANESHFFVIGSTGPAQRRLVAFDATQSISLIDSINIGDGIQLAAAGGGSLLGIKLEWHLQNWIELVSYHIFRTINSALLEVAQLQPILPSPQTFLTLIGMLAPSIDGGHVSNVIPWEGGRVWNIPPGGSPEMIYPSAGGIVNQLLGRTSVPAAGDLNADGVVDAADLLRSHLP